MKWDNRQLVYNTGALLSNNTGVCYHELVIVVFVSQESGYIHNAVQVCIMTHCWQALIHSYIKKKKKRERVKTEFTLSLFFFLFGVSLCQRVWLYRTVGVFCCKQPTSHHHRCPLCRGFLWFWIFSCSVVLSEWLIGSFCPTLNG